MRCEKGAEVQSSWPHARTLTMDVSSGRASTPAKLAVHEYMVLTHVAMPPMNQNWHEGEE